MKTFFSSLRESTKAGRLCGQGCAWLIVLCLFCLPSSAFALGFGTPVIKSHLNEPLRGYVPLLLAGTESLEQVKVTLATPDEYRRLGLQWNDSLASIRVLLPRGSSEAKIELSSAGKITAPMLSIVLKAKKTGRSTYFRHFRILLDPAHITLPVLNKPAVKAVPAQAQIQVSPKKKEDSGWARVWRYGPVRSGDSLSEIAYRLRKDKRWSNRQVMLSLYEENLNGFINRDINRLKSGAWLSVPPAQVVRKNGSKSALLKLDRLMRFKHKPGQSKEKKLTPVAAAKAYPSQELRYSGLISVKRAIGSNDSERDAGLDSAQPLGNLKSIHAEVMSSKLQMDNLGRTVEGLGKSMAGLKMDMKVLRQEVAAIHEAPSELKQEIQSLRKEVAEIKEALPEFIQAMSKQAARTVDSSAAVMDDMLARVQQGVEVMADSMPEPVGAILKNYWAIAFFVLLIACLGFLIGSAHQRRTSRAWKGPAADELEQESQQPTPVEPAPQQEINADVIIQSINKVEESLSQCEYQQAEKSLLELEKHAPDSLKVAVLWAQLYHETDRIEQRDVLISSMNEESDEPRWERFCHLLPAHVWNACFSDGSAEVEPQPPNQPEREKK